jgi:hypothetical protein
MSLDEKAEPHSQRLRQVQTLLIETNRDEKLLQNDTHRPWLVKQWIQSRHGHLSNTAPAIAGSAGAS